jgi:DNA mismatch endonuclease (patch repair protein)
MSAVRGKNTMPELKVRRVAHRLGLRFRLFRGDLPGRPDMTFPRWRTVLFINGCFWHQHLGCHRSKLPVANRAFWAAKLSRNTERDCENHQALTRMGWRVITIWECEIAHTDLEDTLFQAFPGLSRQVSS